jgi:hypothetical protein
MQLMIQVRIVEPAQSAKGSQSAQRGQVLRCASCSLRTMRLKTKNRQRKTVPYTIHDTAFRHPAGMQQFQIWETASSVEPSTGLMVDALRLSTLQNRRFCRVDKVRRTMFGIQHIDCARRIHHGPQETLKFGTAGRNDAASYAGTEFSAARMQCTIRSAPKRVSPG